MAHFNGDPALEAKIKDDLKVTVRCIPLAPVGAGEPGTCPFTGQPSKQRVVWAKAY
jgi:prolyl-tRNA synthetase